MNIKEKSITEAFNVVKTNASDRVIALAGNPNVGKSTVFNALTGLNQHTGNWPGKTVANAQGSHRYRDNNYILVDLPGTYSIMAHSAEEEIARDFILFGRADAIIVVCDATCLERNLNLILQIMELTANVIVCVNLLDEAKKRHIIVDLKKLEKILGVPVVGTNARSGKGLKELISRTEDLCSGAFWPNPIKVRYHSNLLTVISPLVKLLEERRYDPVDSTWLALRLLEGDEPLIHSFKSYLNHDLLADPVVGETLIRIQSLPDGNKINAEELKDMVASCTVNSAATVAMGVLTSCHDCGTCPYNPGCAGAAGSIRDRRLDRILTSKRTGIPIMLLLLCFVFWLTITGANYPSALIASGLFGIQDRLTDLFAWLQTPAWMHGILVLGIYRVLAWVVSVMLPPMAIFFPLFTLLEDFGYLPRVAFNLDYQFKKAKACGKQALTMCMGFGCNAAGIVGCRIIDSPRERLIAILTNNFVPCNGRFPQPCKRKQNRPPSVCTVNKKLLIKPPCHVVGFANIYLMISP